MGNLSQKLRKPQNHLRKVSKGFWLPHKFHCYFWYCCYICVRGGWWVIALFLLLLLLLMLLLLLLFFRTYICRYVVFMMVTLMFLHPAGVSPMAVFRFLRPRAGAGWPESASSWHERWQAMNCPSWNQPCMFFRCWDRNPAPNCARHSSQRFFFRFFHIAVLGGGGGGGVELQWIKPLLNVRGKSRAESTNVLKSFQAALRQVRGNFSQKLRKLLNQFKQL